MKRYIAVLAVLAAFMGSLAAWDTRPDPVLPDGKTLNLPLPATEHMQNVGGSDGAGLCVYTSVVLSAKWHNIPEAVGLRKFAEGRPGGSYPEKLAKDIGIYSQRAGVKLPTYVQHTGGDDAFLDLAMKTRRYPGITYAGRDDFYNGTIAHMVNLVHLDDKFGTIQDNNRAGRWTTDTRKKVLNRWKGLGDNGENLRVGGGWAFVWIAPPAPPFTFPTQAAPVVEKRGAWERVVLGDTYKYQDDPDGIGPSDVIVWVYRVDLEVIGGFWNGKFYSLILNDAGDVVALGAPKDAPRGVYPPVKDVTEPDNMGIDTGRVSTVRRYWVNETEVSQAVAYALVSDEDGLIDDSDRYHLSVVGVEAKAVHALFASGGKLEKYARRLHVQVYTADAWPAKTILKAVVTLQDPASRGGKVIGTSADGSADGIQKVLGDVFDPPPPPKPIPVPGPTPDPTVPKPNDQTDKCILCTILAVLLWFLLKKKKDEGTK